MPKVDWITWKTNTKEIINPQIIMDQIEEKIKEYHNYTTTRIYNSILYEIEKGGLNKESLKIDGMTIANSQAKKILQNLSDINTEIEKMLKKVKASSEEQKKIEKEQLIKEIELKIAEEEKIRDNTISFNDKLQPNNIIMDKNAIQDIIDSSNERIKELKSRLERAKAL